MSWKGRRLRTGLGNGAGGRGSLLALAPEAIAGCGGTIAGCGAEMLVGAVKIVAGAAIVVVGAAMVVVGAMAVCGASIVGGAAIGTGVATIGKRPATPPSKLVANKVCGAAVSTLDPSAACGLAAG